ncbi:cytosolic carboxypeptidase-like protein 5 [Watersipora subatra]|uniref:cytosolic carboxypeptidase-like protein 5 n=1 Tax=Watersipora subatra TaxID=2589382 RepID=UPI00355C7F8E
MFDRIGRPVSNSFESSLMFLWWLFDDADAASKVLKVMEDNSSEYLLHEPSIKSPKHEPQTFHSTDLESLPITGDDFRFGNILFTSKFDSGNLQRVEKVFKESSSTEKPGYVDPVPDVEFNVWTRPDCTGTQFENTCRSWFYFGIKGYIPGKLCKINIMNMNKQGKLYSQGHSPIYRILPHRPQWQRLKEKCLFECSLTEFTLTFYYRFPECRGTVYFSFCYPWSYTESQQQMVQFDTKFYGADADVTNRNDEDIYYHRELFTRSLDGLRVDLLTISSYHGISEEREPVFDELLFPDHSIPRCRQFFGKRVFILTSRVHPGESPASHVYNGFIKFLLRPDDIRAKQLRKQYVFKLIPMLNPDGVVRGHYRTDSRGINLNRLYLNPTFDLYPTIYAAKSLLVFHHVNNCQTRKDYIPDMSVIFSNIKPHKAKSKSSGSGRSTESCASMSSPCLGIGVAPPSPATGVNGYDALKNEGRDSEVAMKRCSSETSEQMDTYSIIGGEVPHLSHPRLRFIPAQESGIAFYVDLHGHASKRGCFMYGNHLTEEEKVVDNLLFPKLISMNSAHFDYGGCNFTEKNMYTKDRKDGHSKEGSGRVAVHKAIGITHSYTLECNYNSGRLVNSLASPADGRITPPPVAAFPPKFTEAHFEEVGRAMAISAIDYTNTNPCSRIQYSELPSVYAVRDWLRRSLRANKGPRYSRPSMTVNPKLFAKSIGQLFLTKSEPIARPIAPIHAASNSNDITNKTGFSFGRTARFSDGNSQPSVASCPSRKLGGDLAPVRDAHRRSFSLPSPTMLAKCAGSQKPRTLSDMTPTKSYSLRLMHTLSRQANKPLQSLQMKLPENNQKAKLQNGQSKNEQAKGGDSTSSTIEQVLPPDSYGNLIDKAPITSSEGNDITPLNDRVKELGIVLEKTSIKIDKKLASKGSKTKKGTNIKATCSDRATPRNGLLQGSNIALSCRDRETGEGEKMAANRKEKEGKQFERKLKSRMSQLEHSEAYWVQL